MEDETIKVVLCSYFNSDTFFPLTFAYFKVQFIGCRVQNFNSHPQRSNGL